MELMYITLNEYIERLKRCGYSISEATRVAYDMHKNFGLKGLSEFVLSVEEDTYVGRVQS